MPQQFTATAQWRADVAVVSVTGEVDSGTAPRLRALLDEVRQRGPRVVVVDLREVSLLASAGLATLIAVHDQALPDVLVRIVAPSTAPAMRSVLLTGLDELLAVHPTVEAALVDQPDG
ncbi:STAS domain-containing protein [Actinosynnema sp. NPDC050436]|uniref:STAS domain-containing protein n=1 Tax=Actinosynnema sp. NPDC050436 TaxID=3155659 RepID=UPI0033E817DE